MNNIIDWFYGQIIGFLGNFFAEMGNMGTELFDLDWVQAIVLFFSQLGWALFGVSLVVCIFEFGVESLLAVPTSSRRPSISSRVSCLSACSPQFLCVSTPYPSPCRAPFLPV